MPVETAISGGDDDLARRMEEVGAQPAEAEATPAPAPTDVEAYKALQTEAAEKTFELGGQTFKLIPQIPAATMLDLALAGDPAATDMERLRGIRAFLDVAVVPEQNALFQRVIRGTNPVIGMEELMALIQKLSELMTGRPTE